MKQDVTTQGVTIFQVAGQYQDLTSITNRERQ